MATRWDNLPGLRDNVVERSVEDYRKSQKGKNVGESRLRGSARDVVREAGQRAQNRNMGRAGMAGAALQGGYDLGREIDDRTGAGKAMVKGSPVLSSVADKMGSSKRVQLSEDAKNRIADMENDQALRDIDAEKEGMKRGGSVKKYTKGGSIDGCAQRGKTKGRMV